MARAIERTETATESLLGRRMTNAIMEMDNILSYISGINDERDSVPLLLAVRDQWVKVKAEIESLSNGAAFKDRIDYRGAAE